VGGDQYNYHITIVDNAPPVVNYSPVAHRIVRTITILKITNPEAIVVYLGAAGAEIAKLCLIIRTYVQS
jgi:hypothetical protein